jgi:hypothetical protein
LAPVAASACVSTLSLALFTDPIMVGERHHEEHSRLV